MMLARDPLNNRLHRRVQALEGPWQSKVDKATQESLWWQNEFRSLHFELARANSWRKGWKIAFWTTLLTFVASRLI